MAAAELQPHSLSWNVTRILQEQASIEPQRLLSTILTTDMVP